jgi:CPA1 family monovalent cation:H+ antiporter
MPWPVALALGAVVAPPDASAATAVLRALRPPHRILVILEGESLLNDATALLIYRVALTAAVGRWSGWSEAPLLAVSIVGGLALGGALGWLYPRLIARIDDVPTSVMFQFIGTFAVWILAARLGLSAIITLVAYAMTVARWSPRRLGARMRIQSYAVWDVAVFVLNVLAFIIAGLQLRPILANVDGVEWPGYAAFGAAVLAVAIVVRIVWVMGYNTAVRWKNRRFGVRLSPRLMPPTRAGGLLISWCGMRGIVTLATALALPGQFPFRDLILFAAYAVVLGTLVFQGLTLRPLMAALDLPADDQVQREVREARRRASSAVIAQLEGSTHQSAPAMRDAYARRLDGQGDPKTDLHATALRIERRTIDDMRRSGEIGDDAYHVVEAEIDWAEMYVEGRLSPPAA